MYKACVIGDGGSIYGFAAAGFDIIDANANNFDAQFESAVKSGRYGAVFVTDELFGLVPRDYLGGSVLPLVMPVSLSSDGEKSDGKMRSGGAEKSSEGEKSDGKMRSGGAGKSSEGLGSGVGKSSEGEKSDGEISFSSGAEKSSEGLGSGVGKSSEGLGSAENSGGEREKSLGIRYSLRGCGMDRLRQICERATGGSAVFDSLEKERDKFDKGGN